MEPLLTEQPEILLKRRLSWLILAIGTLAAAAIVTGTALYLYGKRAALLEDGAIDLHRVNILLLEQTERVYDSANTLLRATVAKLEDGTYLAANDERGLHELLTSYIAGMPHIRALSVVGADGVSLATTFVYPSTRPDLSKRDYFRALKDDPDRGVFIDAPVRHPTDPKQWLLNVARRLPSPDGGFGGVVVISLVPEYFSSFYQSLELVEGSYVSLLREDSTLMVRYPHKDETIGKVFGRNPAIQPFLKQRLPEISLNMYSHISKTNVLLNCRFAKRHPLYVCTSTIENNLLASWKKDAVAIGVATGFVAVLVMVLFVILYRQMRARELIDVALEEKNRELNILSKTDYLTKLANRHSIEARINEMIENARRYGRNFSVVMLDIDHFKPINDTHGHNVGDRALQMLAGILSERIRTTDIAGRWGGEEFLIVCGESDLESAASLAEKLRGLIESQDFSLPSPVTASFGVAQFKPDEEPKDLIARADNRLYAAKEAGRNRVVASSDMDS